MLKEALSRMADVFLPAVLMHGQEYQQKGHVLNIRLSDGLLKARVKGHSGQIYDVHIDLKTWPAKPAHCSCQYRTNCKHAAASLFALQVRENYEIPAPSGNKREQSLNTWLTTLREKEVKKPSVDSSHELVYLLEPQLGGHEHRMVIRLAIAKRLKKGGVGKKIILNSISEGKKQHFAAEDNEIVNSLLVKCAVQGWFERLTIRNSDLIEKILATGRAYLNTDGEPSLTLGERVEANFCWQLEATGQQHLVLEVNGQQVLPLLLDRLLYFDEDNHVIGSLNSPYSLGELKNIVNIPVVGLHQASEVAMKIAETYPQLPLPKIYDYKEARALKPKPVLIFDAIELDVSSAAAAQNTNTILLVIDVLFDYEGVRVKLDDVSPTLVREENGRLVAIRRDVVEEKEKNNEVEQILKLRSATFTEKLHSPYELRDEKILAHYSDTDDLPRLYNQVIPLLKTKGWEIEFAHPFYEEIVDANEVEWFSELAERGNDFFSYQLGILVDGKQVSIVPLVAELIDRFDKDSINNLPDDEKVRLRLPEGKALQVSLGRIKPLIRFLLQYGTRHVRDAQPLEISRYQLILMQETERAMTAVSARWQGGEKFREQLRQLVTLADLPAVESPKGLRTVLRDYQHQGLNWLQFLRVCRFGGVLADDMGLGKTVQTLAHLQVEKEQGRLTKASLIVAPTSLVGNWYEEAKRFTPELNVLVFHGLERHEDVFDDYDLIISTYGLIQRDKSRFIDYPFYYLILDEAQSIKNARTKTTQIIQQIQAEHRLCLSGTPLENHLGELWSLFHFLMPGLLGDAKQFRQFFKTPIEKQADMERRALLAKRVQPFMLRRTKNQVANELPDKTEMTRTIELTGAQRDLYEAIRMSMEKKVREAIAKKGMSKSQIVLLDALLKLRQVCCDPKLLSMPGAEIAHGTSAKLDTLMELLESLMDEGRRVLVFSQFTSMLKLIEEQLIKRDYSYLKLTGQTQNRQVLVNTFQEGKIPIFLISLKAGGTGLNLTRADTVIHYDPWWNPAVEDQATDRSHRIGQENPVFVYKLITSGTVEEAILAMQEKKRQLFDGILSDKSSAMSTLTDSDVEQFFMPLPKS